MTYIVYSAIPPLCIHWCVCLSVRVHSMPYNLKSLCIHWCVCLSVRVQSMPYNLKSWSETINHWKPSQCSEINSMLQLKLLIGQFGERICFWPIRHLSTNSERRLNFYSFEASDISTAFSSFDIFFDIAYERLHLKMSKTYFTKCERTKTLPSSENPTTLRV